MRVEDFIAAQKGEQLAILLFLHPWLTEEMGLHAKMRYGIPFYDAEKWICYLNPLKKGGAEFAFIRGDLLDHEDGLLDQKGRKMVWGLELNALESIPLEALKKKIEEAKSKQK